MEAISIMALVSIVASVSARSVYPPVYFVSADYSSTVTVPPLQVEQTYDLTERVLNVDATAHKLYNEQASHEISQLEEQEQRTSVSINEKPQKNNYDESPPEIRTNSIQDIIYIIQDRNALSGDPCASDKVRVGDNCCPIINEVVECSE